MKELVCRDIRKSFGKTEALKGVSFTLTPGRIYGLLGRNGAGKTTLLHLLSNRYFPTSGQMHFGDGAMMENDAAQSQLYYMGEAMPYPSGMRVKEVMGLTASFYPGFQMPRAEELMGRFSLSGRTKMKALSTGYASILKLIVALSCGAELLLLDEPVLGLDANHRALFYKALLELFAEGRSTIVLSTHLIEEVADIVEEALIIDNGKLLYQSPVEEMRNAAVAVAGSAEAVNAAIQGKRVLSTSSLGAEKTACVLFSYEETPPGVRLSKLGLQELFVQLTNANAGEGLEGVSAHAS